MVEKENQSRRKIRWLCKFKIKHIQNKEKEKLRHVENTRNIIGILISNLWITNKKCIDVVTMWTLYILYISIFFSQNEVRELTMLQTSKSTSHLKFWLWDGRNEFFLIRKRKSESFGMEWVLEKWNNEFWKRG